VTVEDDTPTRRELLEARTDLQRQLDVIRNPVRARDYNTVLAAKLQAMIAEIEECLQSMGPDTD
jgi:hypothetical protein